MTQLNFSSWFAERRRTDGFYEHRRTSDNRYTNFRSIIAKWTDHLYEAWSKTKVVNCRIEWNTEFGERSYGTRIYVSHLELVLYVHTYVSYIIIIILCMLNLNAENLANKCIML